MRIGGLSSVAYFNFEAFSDFVNPKDVYVSYIWSTGETMGRIKVEVYNPVGEKIKVMLDDNQSAGEYKLELKAADVKYNNGIYFIKIMVDNMIIMRKTMLMK